MAKIMNKTLVKYILDELIQGRKVRCNQKHPIFTEMDFKDQIRWLSENDYIFAKIIPCNRSIDAPPAYVIAENIRRKGYTLHSTL